MGYCPGDAFALTAALLRALAPISLIGPVPLRSLQSKRFFRLRAVRGAKPVGGRSRRRLQPKRFFSGNGGFTGHTVGRNLRQNGRKSADLLGGMERIAGGVGIAAAIRGGRGAVIRFDLYGHQYARGKRRCQPGGPGGWWPREGRERAGAQQIGRGGGQAVRRRGGFVGAAGKR